MKKAVAWVLTVALLGAAAYTATHAALAAAQPTATDAPVAVQTEQPAVAEPQTSSPLTTAEPQDASQEAETLIDPGDIPDFVPKLLSVAISEIGYAEGSNNFTKYGQWAGDPNAAWCAEFVCWCVDQTDQRYGTQLLNSVYPNYGGQNVGRDWFIARGRFVYRKGNCPGWGYQWLRGSDHLMTKNEYIPRPGDLVFFSYNQAGDTEHVALVEFCTRAADGSVTVHVLEGNNPDSVQRNRYSLNSSQVLGFGTSEDVADTTLRGGCSGDEVLTLQCRLTQLGYLEARHQTGVYGSNTSAAVAAYQQTMPDKTPTGIADRQTQQAIEAEIVRLEFESPDTWLVADE